MGNNSSKKELDYQNKDPLISDLSRRKNRERLHRIKALEDNESEICKNYYQTRSLDQNFDILLISFEGKNRDFFTKLITKDGEYVPSENINKINRIKLNASLLATGKKWYRPNKYYYNHVCMYECDPRDDKRILIDENGDEVHISEGIIFKTRIKDENGRTNETFEFRELINKDYEKECKLLHEKINKNLPDNIKLRKLKYKKLSEIKDKTYTKILKEIREKLKDKITEPVENVFYDFSIREESTVCEYVYSVLILELFLDKNNEIGKYASTFRNNVINEAYDLNMLPTLELWDFFPELFLTGSPSIKQVENYISYVTRLNTDNLLMKILDPSFITRESNKIDLNYLELENRVDEHCPNADITDLIIYKDEEEDQVYCLKIKQALSGVLPTGKKISKLFMSKLAEEFSLYKVPSDLIEYSEEEEENIKEEEENVEDEKECLACGEKIEKVHRIGKLGDCKEYCDSSCPILEDNYKDLVKSNTELREIIREKKKEQFKELIEDFKEDLKNRSNSFEKFKQENKNKIKELKKLLDISTSEKKKLEKKLDEEKSRIEKMNKSNKDYSDKLSKEKKISDEEKNKLNEKSKEIKEKDENIKRLEKKLNEEKELEDKIKKELDSLKKIEKDHYDEIKNIKSELSSTKERLKKLEEEKEKLNIELKNEKEERNKEKEKYESEKNKLKEERNKEKEKENEKNEKEKNKLRNECSKEITKERNEQKILKEEKEKEKKKFDNERQEREKEKKKYENDRINFNNEKSKLIKELENVREQIITCQDVNINNIDTSNKYNLLKKKENMLERQISDLINENNEFKLRESQLQNDKKLIEEEKNRLEKDIKKYDTLIELTSSMEKELKDKKEECDLRKSKRIKELENEINALKNEEKEEESKYLDEINELKNKISEIEKEKKGESDESNILQEQLVELKNELDKKEKEKNELQNSVTEMVNSAENDKKKLISELEKERLQYQEVYNDLNTNKEKLRQYQYELDNLRLKEKELERENDELKKLRNESKYNEPPAYTYGNINGNLVPVVPMTDEFRQKQKESLERREQLLKNKLEEELEINEINENINEEGKSNYSTPFSIQENIQTDDITLSEGFPYNLPPVLNRPNPTSRPSKQGLKRLKDTIENKEKQSPGKIPGPPLPLR